MTEQECQILKIIEIEKMRRLSWVFVSLRQGLKTKPQRSVWTRQKFSVSSCPSIFHIGHMSWEKSHHLLEYCNPTGKWNCTVGFQVTAPRSLSRNAIGCLSKLFWDRILHSKGWLCTGEHWAVQAVHYPWRNIGLTERRDIKTHYILNRLWGKVEKRT